MQNKLVIESKFIAVFLNFVKRTFLMMVQTKDINPRDLPWDISDIENLSKMSK